MIRTLISIAAALVVLGLVLGPPVCFVMGLIQDRESIRRSGDFLCPSVVGIGSLIWLLLCGRIGWGVIADPIRSWRATRLQPAHICERCGYDLRIDSERCPECGQFQLYGARRARVSGPVISSGPSVDDEQ